MKQVKKNLKTIQSKGGNHTLLVAVPLSDAMLPTDLNRSVNHSIFSSTQDFIVVCLFIFLQHFLVIRSQSLKLTHNWGLPVNHQTCQNSILYSRVGITYFLMVTMGKVIEWIMTNLKLLNSDSFFISPALFVFLQLQFPYPLVLPACGSSEQGQRVHF